MDEAFDNSQITQLLQQCPLGLIIVNSQGEVSWLNQTLTDWLGTHAAALENASLDNLPENLQSLFNADEKIHFSLGLNEKWLMRSQQTLDDNNIVYYFDDVSNLHTLMHERDNLRDELREALAIDEVTGLPNKKALFQSLEPQVSRSRRYNNLLSIVVMQVNNLDQLEAEQANQVLLNVSHMLKDQVRWADIVGKLNDNQFLLVLPETSVTACEQLSGNLNERIASLPLPEEIPAGFSLSAGFGCAEWQKGDDVSLLMQKARKKLEA